MTSATHPRLSTAKLIVLFAALLTLLDFAAIAGVIVTRRSAALSIARTSYAQDVANWHEKLKGCERGKDDRTSIAYALRAQSTYLNLVLDAKSVKADVKRAAASAQRSFDSSASDLETRTGTSFSCARAYPRPPAPVGITPLP